jgi:hypothetical protein
MSPRIILAAVLGISALLPSAAFAQTSPGPGGGTPGTTGTNGGSMGSGTSGGSMGGAHGTGANSGTMNSQLNNNATTPSPYMGAGRGGAQTAPKSSGQGSGASGGNSKY